MHIHTEFSFDSDEKLENYIRAAIERGDFAIGISDHCEYNMLAYDSNYPILDFDGYFDALNAAKKAYGGIKLLCGVEFGYGDDAVRRYKDLLAARKFDYSIMSVHTVNKRGDCCYPQYFDGADKDTAYMLYLDEVYKSVNCDVDFKIAGHIGYVARYAPYSEKRLCYNRYKDILDNILKTMIKRGVCFELNTSAYGLNTDIVTDQSIAARYVELGGNMFSFGSDAHDAARYASGAKAVKRLLSSLGINYTFRFENGNPIKESF